MPKATSANKKVKLITILNKFEFAIREHEMKGAMDPKVWDEIEETYKEWKKFMRTYAKGRMVCLKRRGRS